MSLKARLNLGDHDPLFLVDGTSFLYRGFYAFPDLKRSDGMPTGAIYIVLRILLRILRDERPRHLGFFMDGRGPTFRNALFEPYKAQRPSMPEDLAAQIEPLREAIGLLGLSLTVSDGVEADDCIASLAAAHHATRPVIIVASDKDLKQCLTENVYMWDPAGKNEKVSGIKEFVAENGIRPDQWPDLQALMGDSSDNIPGLPGVGPKTAIRIIQEFPDLESVRDNFERLPESFRKKLEGRVEDIFLYRELTRLKVDCCPDLDLGLLAVRPPDTARLAEFLRTYEFKSLLREIPAPQQAPTQAEAAAAAYSGPPPWEDGALHVGPAAPAPFSPAPAAAPAATPGPGKKAALQPARATQLSLFGAAPESPAPRNLLGATPHAGDLPVRSVAAPSALPPVSGRCVGLVPPEGPGGAFRLALDGEAGEIAYSGPEEALAAHLAGAARIAAPSLQELLRRNPAWGQPALALWFDLGLAAYLLRPEDRNYSFERLRLSLFALPGLGDTSLPDEEDAALAREASSGEPPHPQAQGLAALALMRSLEQRIHKAGLADLLRDLELPLVPVLADMERRGVRIDFAAFSSFLAEVNGQIELHGARVQELAGAPLNVRSSQQLAQVLFKQLGLKPAGKTPGGALSTGSDALERLQGQHPIIDEILAFRVAEKLRSTYLDPLPRLADGEGRLHTRFNQLATATGRLSSSGPNLQNIPIRGPQGARMRACFIAAPGHLLVGADYSQVELRVLAHFSQDPALLDAFQKNEDIHSRTAALLFDKPAADISPDERRGAKTINFGLIYGMGPQKLARELSISVNQAKEFIARYFEKLGTLKAFYETLVEDALLRGFVTTLAGRRRLLPELHSRNQQAQAQARRQAVNTVIQGSAADIIKLAMLRVHADQRLAALDARFILQVHDELLLEAPEAAAPEAAEILRGLMQDVAALRVPLKVDLGIGRTWAEAH
ncbi:MAG: DNA polymerase I [Proteobacteria bacterium]|nr:DNA polymerase I [Pseudomonadota bacterium]MBU1595356.1 DNA polymerase I [Pseudomonadota bacterium]